MDITEGEVTHLEAIKHGLFSSPNTAIEAQVIKRALDGFDQKDKVISNALKAFLDAQERVVKREEKREIVKRIESEEVIDAVVKLRRAEIELRAVEIRQTLAKKKFAIALEDLKLKAEEFEGFDEDYDLNIEKLLIVSTTTLS